MIENIFDTFSDFIISDSAYSKFEEVNFAWMKTSKSGFKFMQRSADKQIDIYQYNHFCVPEIELVAQDSRNYVMDGSRLVINNDGKQLNTLSFNLKSMLPVVEDSIVLTSAPGLSVSSELLEESLSLEWSVEDENKQSLEAELQLKGQCQNTTLILQINNINEPIEDQATPERERDGGGISVWSLSFLLLFCFLQPVRLNQTFQIKITD